MAKHKYVFIALAGLLAITACARQEVTQGPFTADEVCPTFKPRYPSVQITFGNRGLSVLNSLYETFVGEGVFEISEFTVRTLGAQRFIIVGKSNRGELTSDIYADRVVRLGQDLENEQLRRTHQSAFCDHGRIYEHQVVDMGNGSFLVQDLEYWTDGDAFRFRLLQNRRLTADVTAR
ncbi:MAG: hypothetical protein H7Z10_11025 [Gemmatimonadaceae bacterium]|nr:hypothetical protein [Acetobacteraceae bacterium]